MQVSISRVSPSGNNNNSNNNNNNNNNISLYRAFFSVISRLVPSPPGQLSIDHENMMNKKAMKVKKNEE
jgi:hypothetical protein